jgi:hypothetical protein
MEQDYYEELKSTIIQDLRDMQLDENLSDEDLQISADRALKLYRESYFK